VAEWQCSRLITGDPGEPLTAKTRRGFDPRPYRSLFVRRAAARSKVSRAHVDGLLPPARRIASSSASLTRIGNKIARFSLGGLGGRPRSFSISVIVYTKNILASPLTSD
jgi:hypothetical protein